MAKLGFCIQKPTPRINPLLRAGPSVLVCIDSPGLIDSLKPLAPDALYIFRKYRGEGEQQVDDPKARADEHMRLLKPIIQKSGEKYHGYELYNEFPIFDVDTARRFADFQLHCLDQLEAWGAYGAVDNFSTNHPHFPQDMVAMWKHFSRVYEHPAARWRCRHEYIPWVYHQQGDYGHWFRHQKEIAWLRANGKTVLPHIIGEWGWDRGPPVGPWHNGFKVSKEAWLQGIKDYKALLTDDVIAYSYFGAGLDQAWPEYNLTSRRAPQGIVQAVAEFMRQEQEEPEPDQSWARVPEAVRRWYDLLAAESFRLWPYQTIPFGGVQLHGDRVGAAIMMNESGPECRPDTRSIRPAGEFNGVPFYAWGLMQVIARVEGHPWFAQRPTIEELKIPAINIKSGLAIFHGTLVNEWGANGDLWEALRRYSGFAAPHTMAEFWERYGKKFQENYRAWFGILIPGPEEEEAIMLRRKLTKGRAAMVAARNTLNQGIADTEHEN